MAPVEPVPQNGHEGAACCADAAGKNAQPAAAAAAGPAPAQSKTEAADAAFAPPAVDEAAELQTRLGGYYVGALTSNLICLGDRLGLYAALKRHGPCTAADLAGHLGMNERYLAEWLHQQASARVIATDDDAHKFWLTPAQQDCLVHETGAEASPFFAIGGFAAMPGLARTADEQLPDLFRTGGGISYNQVEHSLTCGTCRELAVWVRHALVPSLCSLPGMKEQLEGGCMVADVGCGMGEAAMAVAAAFPQATCHGYDISEEALRLAREEAKRRGLTNVAFRNPGVDDERLPQDGTYQLIMTHDAIHDMAHPSAVMRSVRNAVAPGGCWIIGDMGALDRCANCMQLLSN